jgi:very-long-chain enoyl-CoA reductase
MYVWAIKKHKAYKKEFPQYPKNRRAMFPFIA